MALRPDWIFDNSDIDDPLGYGERAVDFLNRLQHPKSTLPNKQFTLPKFWDRVTRRIYGPRNERGLRQVKTVFCLIPRGGRKTTWAAGLGVLHTVGYERKPNGQVISSASAEDQAAKAFYEAEGIIKETEWIPHEGENRAVKITPSTFDFIHVKSGATFKSISSDGGAQLGSTPSFAIVDELIAWKNKLLWEAISTGMPKEADSLMIIITQAGRGQQNFAYEMYEYAKKVAAGSVEDPSFLPIVFEPPKGADWRSEKLWYQVNPGLSEGFPDIDGLRAAARRAENMASERDTFKQFNLNFWSQQSYSPFVDMDVYDLGNVPVNVEELVDKPCVVAVDVGLNEDLSAISVVWKNGEKGNEEYDCLCFFFCPAENIQGRMDKDKVPYPRWRDEGYLIATPGNVTDYGAMAEFLRVMCKPRHECVEKYKELFSKVEIPRLQKVLELDFDPAYAQAVSGPLTDEGFPTAHMRQGWITMAPAIKEFERAIIGKRFRHAGNPVLRWNVDNIALHTDKSGNKSFHKGNSRDRIDGAVATAMSVGRAHLLIEGGQSFWESANVENLDDDDPMVDQRISAILED